MTESLNTDDQPARVRDAMSRRRQETKRTCSFCGRESTTVGLEEHDACIARLPGVKFACCGHMGQMPYVVEESGATYGREALQRMRELGGNPPSEMNEGSDYLTAEQATELYGKGYVVRQGIRSSQGKEST